MTFEDRMLGLTKAPEADMDAYARAVARHMAVATQMDAAFWSKKARAAKLPLLRIFYQTVSAMRYEDARNRAFGDAAPMRDDG